MLRNDIADINNQKSRKYKEENNRSYPKRFSSLVALMPGIEGGIQSFDIERLQETKLSPVAVFVYNSSVP